MALGDEFAHSDWVDPAVQGAAVPGPSGLSLSLVALVALVALAALLWRRRAAPA